MLAAALATIVFVIAAPPGEEQLRPASDEPVPWGLWPGYVDEIDVRGARPTREVKSALLTITPLLSGCVDARDAAPAVMVVEVDLLAAGFADRLTVLLRDDVGSAIDEACVRTTMRALPLKDRGLEPLSRLVMRLATAPATPSGGMERPPGLSPLDVGRALELRRDEIARCVLEERQKKPALEGTVLARWTVRDDGMVVDVETHEGTLESMDARVCIAAEIARVRFAGGRPSAERVAWPLTFEAPKPVRARQTMKTAWDAPTLFQFIGCMP